MLLFNTLDVSGSRALHKSSRKSTEQLTEDIKSGDRSLAHTHRLRTRQLSFVRLLPHRELFGHLHITVRTSPETGWRRQYRSKIYSLDRATARRPVNGGVFSSFLLVSRGAYVSNDRKLQCCPYMQVQLFTECPGSEETLLEQYGIQSLRASNRLRTSSPVKKKKADSRPVASSLERYCLCSSFSRTLLHLNSWIEAPTDDILRGLSPRCLLAPSNSKVSHEGPRN